MRRAASLALAAAMTAPSAGCNHTRPPSETRVPLESESERSMPMGDMFDPPPPIAEVAWIESPAEARARAADEHKPLIVFVRAAWAQPSVTMDQTIWRDARVLRASMRFIALRIDLTPYVDHTPTEIVRDYGVESVPTTLIIASDGTVVGRYAAGVARAADVAAAMQATH